MAVASLLGGCLSFESLDSGYDIDRAFAIGYRFQDIPNELWTRRFFRFKLGQGRSRTAGGNLLGVATQVILSELGLDGAKVTFVPALASGETVASEKGLLPRIARWCAKQCDSEFAPELLRKNAHPSLHGYSEASQREDIVASAEYTSDLVTTPNVFVLDDLITRGSTLCAIARAIKEQNPGVAVYGVALAKNDRQSFLKDYGHDYYTNDHIPSEWNEIWERHDK